MSETQLTGVEFHLPGAGSISIEWITHNRYAQTFFVGRMDTQLMCPPRDWHIRNPGVVPFDSQVLPVGSSPFSMYFIVDLYRTVIDI
jgi:hypothetical protein